MLQISLISRWWNTLCAPKLANGSLDGPGLQFKLKGLVHYVGCSKAQAAIIFLIETFSFFLSFLFFFFLFLPSFATGNRLGISVMLTMVYPASAATPTDDGFPLWIRGNFFLGEIRGNSLAVLYDSWLIVGAHCSVLFKVRANVQFFFVILL